MKSTGSMMSVGLLLAIGLWACQNQVVTPDVTDLELEAAFAKPPKDPKPPPGSPVYLEFLQPSNPTPGITYDFTSDILIGQGKIQGGWVSADFPYAELSLEFEEERATPPNPNNGNYWCESRSCLRGKCTPFEQDIGVALYELLEISNNQGNVKGKLEVDGADVKFNSIDYDVGHFDMRAWGPGGNGPSMSRCFKTGSGTPR